MGKRFAIVIGVAAGGVMALGAQTATSGQPVDSTPPDLQLSGKKRQELRLAVKVNASCGDEACNVRALGTLTNPKQTDTFGPAKGSLEGASADLAPGETTTLKLKYGKKTRTKARKALDKGRNVQAKVKVHATDAAGNVATAKRTIRLVK